MCNISENVILRRVKKYRFWNVAHLYVLFFGDDFWFIGKPLIHRCSKSHGCVKFPTDREIRRLETSLYPPCKKVIPIPIHKLYPCPYIFHPYPYSLSTWGVHLKFCTYHDFDINITAFKRAFTFADNVAIFLQHKEEKNEVEEFTKNLVWGVHGKKIFFANLILTPRHLILVKVLLTMLPPFPAKNMRKAGLKNLQLFLFGGYIFSKLFWYQLHGIWY